MYESLPPPNEFDNHWFGKPGCPDAPCILKIKGIPRKIGKYLLSFGKLGGVVCDVTGVKAFDSPGDAFAYFRRRYPKAVKEAS